MGKHILLKLVLTKYIVCITMLVITKRENYKMKKFKILSKVLSVISAIPLMFFAYGLSMLILANSFLILPLVGGGLLALALGGASMFCDIKAKNIEKKEKEGYTVEKLNNKDNSKTATKENSKTQDYTSQKTNSKDNNKDNGMEL